MHEPGTCECCDFTHYLETASYIESQLEDLEEEHFTEKLTPKGDDRSLSKQPGSVELEEDKVDVALELFVGLMEDFIHLMNALPVGTKPTGGDTLYEDLEGDWEWDYDQYHFYETEEEITLNEEMRNELSLIFLDSFLENFMINLTIDLILQKITIQKWVKDTRDNIRNATAAQYMLGIGGKNVLDKTDIRDLKTLVRAQWGFLQKFGEEIKNGELSGAKILQRAGMYGEAITHGYEQAKAKSHAIKLPEYPADGNQQCFSNCRCHWRLIDDSSDTNYVLATWTLNPRAEHCTTCVSNARTWNPLRVKKSS